MKQLVTPLHSSLARKLSLGLLLFSTLATLGVTIVQIAGARSAVQHNVDATLQEMGGARLQALTASVWATNDHEVALQLLAMATHAPVEYAAIREHGALTAQAGRVTSAVTTERVYRLEYQADGRRQDLGTLTLVAGLDPGLEQVRDSTLSTLAANAVVIFLATAFVLWLLQHMVTRHLAASAAYVRTLRPFEERPPLQLARREWMTDEIDELVASINHLHQSTLLLTAGLRDSEQRARVIADYTYDWESWHGADGRLHWVSQSVERMTGYSADECMAMADYPLPMIDAAGKADAAEIFRCFVELRSSGNDQVLPVRHRDGRLVWVAVSWQPIFGDNDAYLGIRSSIRDITERRRAEDARAELERQLLQAQKMDAIGHLTGGIAHDFNNMLGAILGYTELGREMLARPGNTERVKGYLDEVMTAGTRAKELIAQMLVFSRLSPEQQGGIPVTLLKPVVKEVSYLLRSSIPTTIALAYRIEDDSLQARIPPVQLHQILLNLGINARDAIGEYGNIEISLGRRHRHSVCASCSQTFDGEYVELGVKDSGQGIAEQQLARIFDPFYTTKAIGKGTGMGLSVVHGIVHGVGGHIEVHSRRNEGSTFRILLPTVKVGAGDTPNMDKDRAYAQPAALAGLRIMVVDDEQAMGAMLQELLSLRGATVTAFNRPVAALAEFMRAPAAVDLVLTDAAMPDLSGMDMARVMLELRPELPIILCTGFSEHASPESARAAGIKGFMSKPLDIGKLVELVASLTPGHQVSGT